MKIILAFLMLPLTANAFIGVSNTIFTQDYKEYNTQKIENGLSLNLNYYEPISANYIIGVSTNRLTSQFLRAEGYLIRKDNQVAIKTKTRLTTDSLGLFRRFNKYLLVRYEELINDTEKTFLNILKFIAYLGRVKFSLDEKKFENTLKTTEFKKMQNLESKESFAEAKVDRQTGEKIKFFNMGVKNDWKKLLDNKIKENLEKELGDEMKELNYL